MTRYVVMYRTAAGEVKHRGAVYLDEAQRLSTSVQRDGHTFIRITDTTPLVPPSYSPGHKRRLAP